MRIVVLSTSLNPDSRSLVLARLAAADLEALGQSVDFVDLKEEDLPLCDGAAAYAHPSLKPLMARLEAADAILVASAIYNFDVNAAAKNLIELTGKRAWGGKVVGLLVSAGSNVSYMSAMGFANSLMLDFRCIIVPRFVFALGKAHFAGASLEDQEIRGRVLELAEETVRIAGALKKPQAEAAVS